MAIVPLQIHVYDGTNSEITTADTARGSSITAAPSNPLGDNWKSPYLTNDTTLLASLGTNGGGQYYNYSTVPNARPVPAPGGGDNYAVFITGKVRVDNSSNPGNQWAFGLFADDDARFRIDLDQDGILEGSIANGVAPPGTSGETVVAKTDGCCAVSLGNVLTIPDGEYLVEMVFTEGNGGDYGEFFYAPAPGGVRPNFSTSAYALIGDGSKGISLDLNSAPTISNLNGDSLVYTPSVSGAEIIDQGAAALTDDAPPVGKGWNGGNLTVSIPAGGAPADDVLAVRNVGSGAGQIGVAGSTISYEGTAIGTVTGGSSGTNLVVTFNGSATTAAVSALLRNITYQNSNALTTPGSRQIAFALTDGGGLTSAASVATISMAVGGAVSTFVWDGTGDGTSFLQTANYEGDPAVGPDANDIVIFRNAIGNGTGSITVGANVAIGELQFDGTANFILNGGSLVTEKVNQTTNTIGTNVLNVLISGVVLNGSVAKGQLVLNNIGNSTTLLGGMWTVAPGATLAAVASGASSGLGRANVTLAGGTLDMRPGAPTAVNALTETIFNGTIADAQNNIEAFRTAALGLSDGRGLLTTALTYEDDAAVSARAAALGAVGFDNNDFAMLWTTTFKPNESGVWGFRNRREVDDNESFWIDTDGNQTFEIGNRFYNRGCCGASGDQFTPTLVAGQSYLLGIVMNDTGGGGWLRNMEVKSPSAAGQTGGNWVPLDPTALPGMFQIVAPPSSAVTNNITVTANSKINLSAGLPGQAFGTLTTSNGVTLTVDSNGVGQSLTFANVSLGGDTIVDTVGKPQLTLRNITETAPGALDLRGNGVVTLPTTNSYSGTTTIGSDVTAVVTANGALGTSAGNTTVQSGGALRFAGNVIYTTSEAVTINGNGNAVADSAISSLSGNNDFYGPITLGSASKIRSEAGNFRLFGQLSAGANALELRADGQMEIWTGLSGSATITKTGGNRTVVLANANAGTTFSGQLNINEGIWDARGNNSLGTTAGATVIANGARLELRDGITLADNITVTGNSGGNGGIRSENNANTLSGVITLAGDSEFFVNATQLTVNQQIQGNRFLTKTGAGLLILKQDNLLSNFNLAGGGVRISTLNGLGSATGVAINAGESLEFDGSLTFNAGATLQNIFISNGTINSISGTTTLETTNIKVGVGSVTFGGAGDLIVQKAFGNGSTVTGLGGVNAGLALWLDASDINGAGDGATGDPANGAVVTTWVDKSGLGRNASVVTNDPRVNATGLNGRPVVNFTNDQLATAYNFDGLSANYTIIGVSRYTGGDNERVIGSTTQNYLFGHHGTRSDRWHANGWIYQGTGANDNDLSWAVYTGAIGPDADGVVGGSAVADFWSDGLQLVNNGTGFNSGSYKPGILALGAGNGGAFGESSNSEIAEVIIYDRVLSDAERESVETYLTLKYFPNSVVKNGTGTVTFQGANNYNGTTTVNAGTLVLSGPAATLGDATSGTVVAQGATLGFANGVALVGESINATGLGSAGQPGVLANISGNNTYTGAITAAVVSAGSLGIGSTAGTLTLNGSIDQQFSQVVFNGAGNVVVNSTMGGIGVNQTIAGIAETLWESQNFPASGSAQNDIQGIINSVVPFDAQGVLTGHLTYPSNAAFRTRALALGSTSWNTNDNDGWTGLWLTTFTPNESGVWQFQAGSIDNDASFWLDTTGNPNIFESTDRFASGTCCGGFTGSTSSLVAGQSYRLGIVARDYESGNFTNLQIKSPSGSFVALNPSALPAGLLTVANISNNAVVKNGTGTVTLGGNNTYNGATTINAGTLVAANNSALGATSAGTTVVGGATLGLQGNVTIPAAEALTVTANGKILNVSGNNAIAGNVATTLVASVGNITLASTAGKLTVQGSIDLLLNNLIVTGSGDVDLQGQVMSSNNNHTFFTPGLTETVYNVNNLGNPTSGSIVGGPAVYLSVRAGESQTGPWAFVGDNETLVYTGQFFDSDGVFSFAEHIDDNVAIFIDGVSVLALTSWDVPSTTGVINVAPGWHNIELRFANGGGGAGPSGTAGGAVGWSTTKGFGLNSSGSTSVDGSNYINPVDPGNGTLFRTNVTTVNVNNSVTKTGTGTLTLSASNTYTGSTTISGGVVQVTNLANGGTASSLGVSSNAASNLVLDGGTLRYIGSAAAATDRLFTLGASGGTLDSAGASAAAVMSFTNAGAVAFTGSGPRTLTLTGNHQGLVGGFGEYNGGSPPSTVAATLGNGSGGNVSLVKSGTGVWVLSGNNTYAGGTSLSSGHLALRSSTALGSGDVNVAAGAQLAFSAHGLTVANNITLNGLTTYAWGGDNLRGALVGDNLGGGGDNTLTGNLVLNATSNVSTSWNDKSLSISGLISGAGGLQVDQYRDGNGPSSIRLTRSSSANTYTGGTTINSGIVRLGNGGTSGFTSHEGALGTGTVTINAGTQLALWIKNDAAFTIANPVVLNGGTLHAEDGNYTMTGAMTINGASTLSAQYAAKDLTIAGKISGTGPVTIQNIVTDNGGAVVFSNSTNDYTGNTVVTHNLRLGATQVIPDGAGKGNVSVAGNLNLNGFSETINGLTGAGTITNGAATAATLTVGANDQSSTFSGLITNGAGTTALTKVGSGTLILSGANTYTGATTINGGTLSVSTLANGGVASNLGAASNAASNLVINNGATLQYTGGSVSIDRGITLGGGAGRLGVTNAATTLATSGTLVGGGNALRKAGPGTLALSGTGTAGSLEVGNNEVGGTLQLSGTLSSSGRLLIGLGSGSGTLNVTGGTTVTSASPFNNAHYIGVDGGTGTLNVSGGSLVLGNGAAGHLHVGANSGTSTGTVNVTGGTLDVATRLTLGVGSSRVDLQACKLEYSIVSPK